MNNLGKHGQVCGVLVAEGLEFHDGLKFELICAQGPSQILRTGCTNVVLFTLTGPGQEFHVAIMGKCVQLARHMLTSRLIVLPPTLTPRVHALSKPIYTAKPSQQHQLSLNLNKCSSYTEEPFVLHTLEVHRNFHL